MKIHKPEYLPSSASSKEEMMQMQREIAREAVFEDKLDFNSDEDITLVGVDQAFTDEKSVSCAVAMKNGEIIEEVSAAEEITMPYIPGLLAFREGGSIVRALRKLDVEPDFLMLDGSGRIHYKQAGIATHIGVIFYVPAVGVAKNLLCGEPKRPVEKLDEGEKVEILSDSKVGNFEDGTIGYALQSKQYKNSYRINPLYVSPGHKISNKKSVQLAKKYCSKYKLPEPLRLADSGAKEMK